MTNKKDIFDSHKKQLATTLGAFLGELILFFFDLYMLAATQDNAAQAPDSQQ